MTIRTRQPTLLNPLATVEITVAGVYRAAATNGIASATTVSIRPGSAIARALSDLRMDYPETSSIAVVSWASVHDDDVREWAGRSVSCVGVE